MSMILSLNTIAESSRPFTPMTSIAAMLIHQDTTRNPDGESAAHEKPLRHSITGCKIIRYTESRLKPDTVTHTDIKSSRAQVLTVLNASSIAGGFHILSSPSSTTADQ